MPPHYYLNFRAASTSSPQPRVLSGDGLARALKLGVMPDQAWRATAAGKDLLLIVHGFNVSFESGVRSAARLSDELALGDGVLVAGVLWPGDFWIPVINYPAEAADAVRCGHHLAAFINAMDPLVRSVSIASHSLGGRLALEALSGLDRAARMACLTAAAVDDDVFVNQYARVGDKAKSISVLASRNDRVLQLAYPAGDLVSDAFYDDDSPFRLALGRRGSRPRRARDFQIPKASDYGHHNYFPPAKLSNAPKADELKWKEVAGFIKGCFLDQAHAWPPPGQR